MVDNILFLSGDCRCSLLTAMSKLTEQMCWKLVKKERDEVNKIGVAIYQKPLSNECYEQRSQNEPPLCEQSDDRNAAWYFLLYLLPS